MKIRSLAKGQTKSDAGFANAEEIPADTPRRHFVKTLLEYLALPGALLVLYLAIGIVAQALFINGFFLDKPRARHVFEVGLAPLGQVYDHSPAFRSVFDPCVAVFVSKKKHQK
jgi:hypothetical protein